MLEREFVGMSVYHRVSRTNLTTVCRHACRYYKIKAPKLVVYDDPTDHTFGWTESTVHEDGSRSHFAIRLNRGFDGANLFTLLHELAHYITDETWVGHSSHGPKFVGIYMHLLHKYRMVPSDAFRVVAKRFRIKIAGKFKPSAIRG